MYSHYTESKRKRKFIFKTSLFEYNTKSGFPGKFPTLFFRHWLYASGFLFYFFLYIDILALRYVERYRTITILSAPQGTYRKYRLVVLIGFLLSMNEVWFIKLHRKIKDNPIFWKPNYLAIFMYLLLECEYRPAKKVIKWEIVELEAGETVFFQKELADRFWISLGSVSNIIKKLKSETIIETRTNNKYSIARLINWTQYQDDIETTSENQLKTDWKPIETPKEVLRNIKNTKEIYISEFSEKFQETYKSWLDDRKSRKKSVTEKAKELQLKRCLQWWEEKAIKIIEQAIEKWWTGLEDYWEKKSWFSKPEKKSLTQIFNESPWFFW